MSLQKNNNAAPSSSNSRNRRYLCQAPRPESWEDYVDAVLNKLGPDRKTLLHQTLTLAQQKNPFTPRTGPGRKTNAEHAISFYEFLLKNLESGEFEADDSEVMEDEDEEEGGSKEEEEDDNEQQQQRGGGGGGGEESKQETTDTKQAAVEKKEEEEESSMGTEEFNAQHNDLCDVCDGTGELLMCSTCNLVFHLECVRPIMTELPKEKDWRCAYCILATSPKNTKPRKVAAAAVRMMARLRNKNLRKKRKEGKGGSKIGEKNSESSVKPSVESATAEETGGVHGDSESSPVTPGGRSKRERKQPIIFDPQSGPAKAWQTDELLEWKVMRAQQNAESSSSEDEVEEGYQSDASRNRDNIKGRKGSVFCSFCKDDPNIKVCVFCACRVCFGKHHQTKLLLCDHCDDEYHTFCLDPPLTSVPKKKWFCPNCKQSAEKRMARSTPRTVAKGSGRKVDDSSPSSRRASARQVARKEIQEEEKGSVNKKRKRGRPPSKTPTVSGRKRGRPRKNSLPDPNQPPRKRGRPPKSRSPSLSSSSKKRRSSGSKSAPKRASPATSEAESSVVRVLSVPVTISRSGRTVKRSSFHDEIEQGEQHLRATRSSPDAQEAGNTQAPSSIQQIGQAPEQSSDGAASGALPTGALHSFNAPAGAAKQATQFSLPGVLATTSISAASMDGAQRSSGVASLGSRESSTTVAASVPAVHAPGLSGLTPATRSTVHRSHAESSREAKVPRRKPGARECMQISRRFGVDVIPQNYMDILLDYCKRGKVEHLIRMRERLDDHSRFLESQLAGLEALIQQREREAAETSQTEMQMDTSKISETTEASSIDVGDAKPSAIADAET